MLLQLTGVHLSCLYSKNISYFKLILIPSMLLTIILSLFDMADLDDEKANIFNMIRSILNKYCIIKRGVFSESLQSLKNGIKYTLGYHLNDVKLIVGIRSTYSMIQYGISGLGFIFYIIGIKCKVKEKDLTNQY